MGSTIYREDHTMAPLPKEIVRHIMRYLTTAEIISSRIDLLDDTMIGICTSCRQHEDQCACHPVPSRVVRTSKAEDVYFILRTCDRLVKMLDIKVMMNWLKRNIDITPKRPKEWDIELTNLQEWFPIFCHCNKDLIHICLTMLCSHTRNASFNLITYDDLYQEFISDDN